MRFTATTLTVLCIASNVVQNVTAFAFGSNNILLQSTRAHTSSLVSSSNKKSSRKSFISTLSMAASNTITEGNGGGVVITGAAGGVGFAYAGEFMDRGYDVVICDVKDCSTAAKALASRHPNGRVFHTKCDVSDVKSVEALGKFAQQKMGRIGYWINNAGINGGRRAFMDVPVQTVEAVVKVNLLGVLYGTKIAMDIMAAQVSGSGSDSDQLQYIYIQYLFVFGLVPSFFHSSPLISVPFSFSFSFSFVVPTYISTMYYRKDLRVKSSIR